MKSYKFAAFVVVVVAVISCARMGHDVKASFLGFTIDVRKAGGN